MDVGITISIFLFGTIIGSFLNVVILRYGTENTLGGRSFCRSCKTQLRWEELIPVVSFIVQRGRCKSCSGHISWQYPLVELSTGILFVLVFMKFFVFSFSVLFLPSLLSALFSLLIISLLIIITVIDWHHKIIPNPFVYALIVLGGLSLFIDFQTFALILPSMWAMLAGPILFSPFALLWLVSRGRWMGFGDAKLAIAIGWLLGLQAGTTAIVFAFWIGAFYFIVLIVIQKIMLLLFSKKLTVGRNGVRSKHFTREQKLLTIKSEVPFGPFMVLGMLVVFFTDVDLLSFIGFLFF